jgi:hypothetical protein
MGKSAILSAWLARREATGAMVPHHFIRRQVADWDQPEVIAASLAAQIEAAFPALRDNDAKPERRLVELLGRVSKQLGGTGRMVVVVDGLDGTRAEPGGNPLPRFLPQVMPAGIRFLCATRPTYPHLNWLEARSPVRRLDLDDARWAASNEAVVRGFWEAVGREYQPPLPGETIATAIARAKGNVLHTAMLHDALRDLPAAGLAFAPDPSGTPKSDHVQEAVAAFHPKIAPKVLVAGFGIGATFLLLRLLVPSDRPPSDQAPQCRLAIDDVVIASEQGRVALDVRVRNAEMPSESTGDYKVPIDGNFIPIKDAHNSTPISQAIPKDDVDRFVLHLGFFDDRPCRFKAEVILMYNGECVAASKPINFSTPRQR